jgi:hypothetical protein
MKPTNDDETLPSFIFNKTPKKGREKKTRTRTIV